MRRMTRAPAMKLFTPGAGKPLIRIVIALFAGYRSEKNDRFAECSAGFG